MDGSESGTEDPNEDSGGQTRRLPRFDPKAKPFSESGTEDPNEDSGGQTRGLSRFDPKALFERSEDHPTPDAKAKQETRVVFWRPVDGKTQRTSGGGIQSVDEADSGVQERRLPKYTSTAKRPEGESDSEEPGTRKVFSPSVRDKTGAQPSPAPSTLDETRAAETGSYLGSLSRFAFQTTQTVGGWFDQIMLAPWRSRPDHSEEMCRHIASENKGRSINITNNYHGSNTKLQAVSSLLWGLGIGGMMGYVKGFYDGVTMDGWSRNVLAGVLQPIKSVKMASGAISKGVQGSVQALSSTPGRLMASLGGSVFSTLARCSRAKHSKANTRNGRRRKNSRATRKSRSTRSNSWSVFSSSRGNVPKEEEEEEEEEPTSWWRGWTAPKPVSRARGRRRR